MNAPWWVKDREELGLQVALVVVEVLVSASMSGFTLLVLTTVLNPWDQPMEGVLAWGFLSWFLGAFLIILGLFLRAHWKSLGGWKKN